MLGGNSIYAGSRYDWHRKNSLYTNPATGLDKISQPQSAFVTMYKPNESSLFFLDTFSITLIKANYSFEWNDSFLYAISLSKANNEKKRKGNVSRNGQPYFWILKAQFSLYRVFFFYTQGYSTLFYLLYNLVVSKMQTLGMNFLSNTRQICKVFAFFMKIIFFLFCLPYTVLPSLRWLENKNIKKRALRLPLMPPSPSSNLGKHTFHINEVVSSVPAFHHQGIVSWKWFKRKLTWGDFAFTL